MKRRYDDATRARACELWRSGTKTRKEIAEEMQLSVASISYLTCGIAAVGSRNGVRVRPWRDEWTALLGTNTDRAIAARIGMSPTYVSAYRLALGIPSVDAHARHRTALACISDEDLARRTSQDIAAEAHVPVSAIRTERHRRNVRFRYIEEDMPALRRAAVAGMLTACGVLRCATGNGAQTQIAEILGVSRERARQLCDEVRAALALPEAR